MEHCSSLNGIISIYVGRYFDKTLVPVEGGCRDLEIGFAGYPIKK
jgi:hypothetical protein